MPGKRAHPTTPESPKLVKMSVLARLSGTPAATLKHYVREGLIDAAVRTSRNMALYDPALVPRIQKIKELQRTRFLPLRIIKQVLEGQSPSDDRTVATTLAHVLEREGRSERRTRAELIERGLPVAELDWLAAMGLLSPKREGKNTIYSGDDLALLRTLGASRKAGLGPEMLPFAVLETYVRALKELVRAELEIFRAGVLPRAGKNLPALTEAAATLSERLVVLLRRKMLLPTLDQLVAEELRTGRRARKRPSAPRSARGSRTAPRSTS